MFFNFHDLFRHYTSLSSQEILYLTQFEQGKGSPKPRNWPIHTPDIKRLFDHFWADKDDPCLLSLRPLVSPLSFWLTPSCLRLKAPKKSSKYENKWNQMLKHLICHFCFRIFQQLPHFSDVCGCIFKSKVRISNGGISAKCRKQLKVGGKWLEQCKNGRYSKSIFPINLIIRTLLPQICLHLAIWVF